MATTIGRAHTDAVREVYGKILSDSPLRARRIEIGTGQVHVVEGGQGPPLVALHGTGSGALLFHPLLVRLERVRVLSPDRPGQGLSDAAELPRDRFREAAVAWVDSLLDALGLGTTALLGHSMGGLWALWYALARPERVDRLVLLGPPQLPGTRCPLPFRVLASPVLGAMMQRLAPPSPTSVLQFAHFMGEGETFPTHPSLIDLLVATGRDPVAAAADLNEVRAIVPPHALLTPSGFRRAMRVQPDQLRQLCMPTLLMWGEHEPLGGEAIARAVAHLVPDARLELLAGGHAPWLGDPDHAAELISDFLH